MHNYESSMGAFPCQTILTPIFRLPNGTQLGAPKKTGGGYNAPAVGTYAYTSSWSAFARAFPYMEKAPMYNSINFASQKGYSANENATVNTYTFNVLHCPSDQGLLYDDPVTLGGTGPAAALTGGSPYYTPTTSYGVCEGNWYVFSINWSQAGYPEGPKNEGMFGPNQSRKIRDITDGLSNTMMAAEGYVGHAQRRSCYSAAAVGDGVPTTTVSGAFSPTNFPLPGKPSRQALAELITACTLPGAGDKAGGPIGHTRGLNGGVYYSGFTTALTPNHGILGTSGASARGNYGQTQETDWDNVDENDFGLTYAAVSASSRHTTGVNVLMGDGSVRYVMNQVDPVLWKAMGSVAGGETVNDDGGF